MKTRETQVPEIGIAFQGMIKRIATSIDGGWDVTFSAPHSETENIMKLSGHRDTNLQVGIVPYGMVAQYSEPNAMGDG